MGGRKKMTEKRDWSDSRKGFELKSAGSLKLKKKKGGEINSLLKSLQK